MTIHKFAAINRSGYEFFIERVDLKKAGEANKAIDNWKKLQAEGWDVEALGSVDGTHMIGLGCWYEKQLSLEASA